MGDKIGNNFLSLNNEYFTKVKLVIGNGFDLQCGLNSSYKHFFKDSKSQFDLIKLWMEGLGEFPSGCSVWDLCFYLLSIIDNGTMKDIDRINWRDVENNIAYLLDTINMKSFPITLNKHKLNEINNNYQETINRYLFDVLHLQKSNEMTYYNKLLEELEAFETRFSNYIKGLMDKDYQDKAWDLLTNDKYLACIDKNTKWQNIVSIDTFNYTTPDVFKWLEEKRNVKIRHINGTLDGPIFGIDSANIALDDPRYKFTKTYRKMIMLVEGKRENFKRHFENVVVYGHSLSKADYSYFFSIMDKLNLNDFSIGKSRFVVAFINYEGFDRKRLAWQLLELLNAFDKWKNPGSNRYGLVDILETSDRIGFAELPADN